MTGAGTAVAPIEGVTFHSGGNVRPAPQVSRQERMLYGDDAPLVRRLGDAAGALEDALARAGAAKRAASTKEDEVALGKRLAGIHECYTQVCRVFRSTAEQAARDMPDPGPASAESTD